MPTPERLARAARVDCYKGRRQIAVKVKRVVANVAVSATAAAKRF